MLLDCLSSFTIQVDCGELPISAPGYERVIIGVHPKSQIRFIPNGVAEPIGSFSGYRPKNKSKVVRTMIHESMVNRGYNDKYGCPDMTWKPWDKALRDMVEQNHVHHDSKLRLCEDAFVNDLLTGLGDKIHDLEVYTLDVALNGADGVTFVDSINTSTSAGNPFKKSKKNFMSFTPEGKIDKIDDVILDRVNQIEACYSRGQRFHPQFCAHLKDEALPQRKIDSAKTRVFTGGEFAWMLVMRRYFLSHIRLMMNNPFLFEAMPGIVAQSVEWQRLHDHVTKFGSDRLIGGDYGNFDRKMRSAFILSAFNILIRLAEAANWSEDDLMALRCMSYDTAFPCVDFNGDIINLQLNPSGHPLTVVINCLVNSLYMRYAYLLVSGKTLDTFQQNVALCTYGDDNLMGVSPDCPKFTHTRIAVALKCIGVVYTMADKDSESTPYIDINQASFLKRGFVYDPNIGAVVAPLELSSFDKMLTTCVRSDTLAPEAHAICVIETALREYFFHGKEVFLSKFEMFQEVVKENNLEAWVRDSTFPKYGDLVHQFWLRFGDVRAAEQYSTPHL